MATFIKKIFLFLSLPFAGYFVLNATSNFIIRSNASFNLPTNPKYIILGHSHPECAYNDSLISNFTNLSESGEAYFYTFQKVEKLIEQNPNLETIFIEFSNNQITQEMDSWTWDLKYVSYRYPRYSAFMNLEDNWVLIRNKLKSFSGSQLFSFKYKWKRILKNDFNFSNSIGEYKSLGFSKVDSLINAKNPSIENKVGSEVSISEVNLLYLEKIIEHCQKNDKRVILFRSPLHTEYEGYRNEKNYTEILQKRFQGVQYIDLSKFPLKDEMFLDLEHLNSEGATMYSTWFNKMLENDKLDSLQNQLFVEDEFKKINW